MWKNYFKITLRGFAKQKLTFFINLFGLALGLWAAILIGLWVRSELAMDRHFADIDQVYRMMEHQSQGQEILTTTMTPGILARELKEVSPEVELAACFTWMEDLLFVNGDKRVKLEGIYAEPDYLHILRHGILHGDRTRLLTEKSHLVLTQEAAMRLFGRSDVVGETIEINGLENENTFVVQAVLETIPATSSIQFDFILPFQIMLNIPGRQWLDGWATNGPNTLVKLHKEVDVQAFSAGIENFIKERSEGNNVRLFAYPQKDLYLYGEFQDGVQVGGRIEHVKLFSIIGLFVLLIACINFMNLSTAKSQQRAKEVGVRKVVGAGNGSLVRQFLGESLMLTSLASLFALLLVQLTLPLFNNLTDKSMSIPYGEWMFWIQIVGVILLTGLIAGSYPAFYLSATKVASVFRHHARSGKHVVIVRKSLVLIQFMLATLLIVSTVVVYQQINYALDQNIGYEKKHLLEIPLEGKLSEAYEVFENRLRQIPEVQSVSKSSHSLMEREMYTGGVDWEGKTEDVASFEIMWVDYDFIETLGMKLIKGEDFLREKGADSIQGAIVNRKAYELIAQDNPSATSFRLWGEERSITGVVEDFHFQSFHQNMEPAIMILNPGTGPSCFVRLGAGDIQNTIASIRSLAEEINPDFPFEYSFMDENYARLYREDLKMRDLAGYFSILTILISCLGLLGLSSHIADQKIKEIGIRKVLGASTFAILHVINREFVVIVTASIVLGSGLAYWLMQKWLAGYAYRIGFEWWFIPLAAVVILSIAYLTVTLQALKATGVNPVESLRSE